MQGYETEKISYCYQINNAVIYLHKKYLKVTKKEKDFSVHESYFLHTSINCECHMVRLITDQLFDV